jgi:hypothetical protein
MARIDIVAARIEHTARWASQPKIDEKRRARFGAGRGLKARKAQPGAYRENVTGAPVIIEWYIPGLRTTQAFV